GLTVSHAIARDAAFYAWFAGFPDLAAEERRQTEAAIAADARFGSTPTERLQRLAAARKFARGFNLVALAIIAWGWLDPRPYGLVIAVLAIIPWAVLLVVAASRGLCGVGGRAGQGSLL